MGMGTITCLDLLLALRCNVNYGINSHDSNNN